MNPFRYTLTTAALLLLFAVIASAQSPDPYDKYPFYHRELGVDWSVRKTTVTVWAPKADTVKLRLYKAGSGGEAIKEVDLDKKANGSWKTVISQNLKNKYYTFQVKQDGKWLAESPDIYAKAVGVNGHRGMVVDLKSTDPIGWKKDKSPKLKNANSIIIYETHIRDISIDP